MTKGNSYIKNEDEGTNLYIQIIKPILDKSLSFIGLVLLSPIYAVIAILIFIDDPGPIFFTQRRVGINGTYFMLHKFRSMKLSTPHDVPTHKLSNPDQYITRFGKVLRKTSLDELPQIWDIFRGKMSVIGPRPALWNQKDLVTERDKYGANFVLPGLTGLAQISGRDKLEIPVKAKLDGKYVMALKESSWTGFFMDLRCFFGTIASVIRSDGIVEGKTGALSNHPDDFQTKAKSRRKSYTSAKKKFKLRPDVPEKDPEIDWGFKKKFEINQDRHVKILITGDGSYIGESFRNYAYKYYPNITINTLNMLDDSWRDHNFSNYDAVFHVAGIAHADVGKVSAEEQEKYYRVNTDLAIETAQRSKAAGVKQFIFMSSIIIYDGKEYIDEDTIPVPSNFYGDSKWQADKGIRALADEQFHVAVLRPPMIYGYGSKGNYPTLVKLAKKLPVFPRVENKRSMLYIENLCEFLCKLVLSEESGVYVPQNKEYSNTSELVQIIGKVTHRSIHLMRLLAPAVWLGSKVPGKVSNLVNKAFGNSCYDQKLSSYKGLKYQKFSLRESIERAEGIEDSIKSKSLQLPIYKPNKPSVLILVNHDVVIYNFRLELVERLLADGYEVYISSPYGERIDDLIALGAKYHEIYIDRHGMNPIAEIGILAAYRRLIKEIKPIIIFGYTIKPNIYGALAAQAAGVPFVANITGLGMAVENGGLRQKLMIALYHFAFGRKHGRIQRVFFQNKKNRKFFVDHNIALDKHGLLPGSGVNLDRYSFTEYPECGNGIDGPTVKFAFISRIMREKGIEEYLNAAETVKGHYPNTEFHIAGFSELEYKGRLKELDANHTVIYHGMIRDVAGLISQIHCVVHPTYYPEGLSNTLLEACASGRPIITTNRPGCQEVCKNGANGYLVDERSTKELVTAIERFIKLPVKQKKQMGLNARKLVEDKFDRKIVVEAYMDELKKAEHHSEAKYEIV